MSRDLTLDEADTRHDLDDGCSGSPQAEGGDFAYPLHRNREFHRWSQESGHDGEIDENDENDDKDEQGEPKSSHGQSTPEQNLIDRIVDDLNGTPHCDSDSAQSTSVILGAALTDPFIDAASAPRTLSVMLSDLFPRDAEAVYTYDELSNPDMSIPADHAIDFDELAERLANIKDRSSPNTEGNNSSVILHRQDDMSEDGSPSTMTMSAIFQDVGALIDVAVDTDARLTDVRETVERHHDEQRDTSNELGNRLQEVADNTYDRLVQVRTELALLQARVAEVEDVGRGLEKVRKRLAISESADDEHKQESGSTGQGVYPQQGLEHGSVTAGLGVYHHTLLRGVHASAPDLFRRRSHAGVRSSHAKSSSVVEEDVQLQRPPPANEGPKESREEPPEGALVLWNKDNSNEHDESTGVIVPDTDAANYEEEYYYELQSGSGWANAGAQLQAYFFAICIVAGASLI